MSGAGRMAGRKRPRPAEDESASSSGGASDDEVTKIPGVSAADRIVGLLEKSKKGLTQAELMAGLSDISVELLLQGLQQLMDRKRVEMYYMPKGGSGASSSAGGTELLYRLVSAELAAKLADLTPEDTMVLQLVEKAGNVGIWVRHLKQNTRLQQTALNKCIKRLESRKLIKAVRSVAYRSRRMYMSFNCEPAKELTGGPWYSEQELDLEFIEGVRNAVLHVLDQHGPLTAAGVAAKVQTIGVVVSVKLQVGDIAQLLDTLVWDGLVDYAGGVRHRSRCYSKPSRSLYTHSSAGKGMLVADKFLAVPGGGTADADDAEDEFESGYTPLSRFVSPGGAITATDGRSFVCSSGGGALAPRIGLGAGAAARAAETAMRHRPGAGAAEAVEVPDRSRGRGRGGGGAGAGAGRGSRYEADDDLDDDEDEDDDELDEEDKRYFLVRKLPAAVDGFSSSPCGVCPVFSKCTPGGLISPTTCVYYSAWLEW